MGLGVFDSKPRVRWLRGQSADATVALPGGRSVLLRFDPSLDAVFTAEALGLRGETAREVRFTDEAGRYDRITNVGHPFLTVVSVGHAVMQYLRKHEPSMLMFSAGDHQRARLYEAFMERVDVPGYRVYREDSDLHAYFIIQASFQPKPTHGLVLLP